MVVVPLAMATAVHVNAGQQWAIDFSTINPSLGDSWSLLATPDPAVLRDLGQQQEPTDYCPSEAVGCNQRLLWRFAALGAGTTTLRFQYCYRSTPPSCRSNSARGPSMPFEVPVTVT